MMDKKRFNFRVIALIVFATLILGGCRDNSITNRALYDKESIYYADYKGYPGLKSLPVGMFDSGTGGLTVMEQFLFLDSFNNETGEEGPDGIPDFDGEAFIYLADQANMPYGVYPSQGKSDFLRELIIKDALFLTSEPYRTKIVVIACNTATAYGLEDIRWLLERSKTGVRTVGVIEAGVDGAMSLIPSDSKSFAVGVLATVGTISSGGYEDAIYKYAADKAYSGDVRVVNQGGLGFAEAVDSEPDYISGSAQFPRTNYRGPRYNTEDGISCDLMKLYNFDTTGNALLVSYDESGEVADIQLNSTGNYARFHMVTLLNKHKEQNPGVRMKSVILGCTHYPYLEDTLKKVTEELRMYEENGEKVYASLLAEELHFIDPAINTAKETFRILFEENLLDRSGRGNTLAGFISVPREDLTEESRDESGNFTFDYKYGRETGSEKPDVRIVPFSYDNINQDNLNRIRERLPLTYSLIIKEL